MDALTAMRMALDALLESADLVRQDYESDWRHGMPTRAGQLAAKKATVEEHDKAIAALDAAIAQAERAEPVAVIRDGSLHWWIPSERYIRPRWTNHGEHRLYAAPVTEKANLVSWMDVVLDQAACKLLFTMLHPSTPESGEEYNEVRLQFGDGHSGFGLYVSLSEYPEEGAELLVKAEHAAPVAKPVHHPVHGWTDADADAARLALELECILTDPDQPMPSISRWWDSAHEALELHRQRMAEPPTESMDRRAATARPAPAQADLSASGPPITDDDLRAMLPGPTLQYLPHWGERGPTNQDYYTADQMLAYGRAIVARMGGMK